MMREKRRPRSFDEMITELEESIRADEKEFYGEKLVEEALDPRNVGVLAQPDGAARVTGQDGESMQIHVQVEEGTIRDCKFTTDARGPTIAFASVLTELVKGKTVEEALKIEPDDVESALGGLPEGEEHTPELAVTTLRAALEDYKKRH
jgi:nitrogen fixation NifU-like protein